MPSPKRILFPIYHFLPCATTHIHRVMRFLNHLAQTKDYDITVLTCKNPNDILYDESLINKLDPGIKIIRTHAVLFGIHNKSRVVQSYLAERHEKKRARPSFELLRRIYRVTFRELFNFINVPDNCIGWLPFAYFRGKKLMKVHDFDIILTTGPPFSNFVISALLKKPKTKLVLDYRDPWKNNYYMEQTFRAGWQTRLSHRLETYVLRKADFVIANTRTMADFIKEQNRRSFADRQIGLDVIYNGYPVATTAQVRRKRGQHLTIVHSGRFHGEHRTPKYFLQAARELIDEGRVNPDKFRVIFLGNIKPTDFELFAQIRTDDFCVFRGMAPHAIHLETIRKADCLLVIGGRGSWEGMFVPSKIYEYLQTNNQILALLPSGEAQELLERANGAILVEPDNIAEIKVALARLFDIFKKNGSLTVDRNWSYLKENFDAATQAKRLKMILEVVAGAD